jgi:hypothetical protein
MWWVHVYQEQCKEKGGPSVVSRRANAEILDKKILSLAHHFIAMFIAMKVLQWSFRCCCDGPPWSLDAYDVAFDVLAQACTYGHCTENYRRHQLSVKGTAKTAHSHTALCLFKRKNAAGVLNLKDTMLAMLYWRFIDSRIYSIDERQWYFQKWILTTRWEQNDKKCGERRQLK